MDEGLMLKDQLRQFQQTSMDETQKLQRRFVREMSLCFSDLQSLVQILVQQAEERRFVREMSLCFSDLQSLVQILVQQAEGKDPNVSLLLGTRGRGNYF